MAANNPCSKCVSTIVSLGFSALILWLILRPSKPKLSILDFYVPALNKSANPNLTLQIPPHNTTVSFHLKLRNPKRLVGIYYDALDLSFYYLPNHTQSLVPVGNLTLPAFYQGHAKTAHRREELSLSGRAFWEEALREASQDSRTSFKVGVATAVRYKILAWKTRHHGLRVDADVEVNQYGTKSTGKGVRLHSSTAAGFHGRCHPPPWTLVFGPLFPFFLLL